MTTAPNRKELIAQAETNLGKKFNQKERTKIELNTPNYLDMVELTSRLTEMINKDKIVINDPRTIAKLKPDDQVIFVYLLQMYQSKGLDLDYFISGAGASGACIIN